MKLTMPNGIPQGTFRGPILFKIDTNVAFSVQTAGNVLLACYGDMQRAKKQNDIIKNYFYEK